MSGAKVASQPPAWAARHPRWQEYLARDGSSSYSYTSLQNARVVPLIESRFPGLEITGLQHWPKFRDDTCEMTRFHFSWEEAAVLAAGLVKAENVPQRPKRVFYGGHESVYREKGGRLATCIEVRDDVDDSHPLAFLRPSVIRGSYDDSTRDEFLDGLWNCLCSIEGVMLSEARVERHFSRNAWIVHPDDMPKLQAVFARARDDLAATLEDLRLKDRRRPPLRLVDNTRGAP